MYLFILKNIMLEMYECVTKCIYELIMRKYGTKSYGPKIAFIVINVVAHLNGPKTMQYVILTFFVIKSSTVLIYMFLK